MRQTYAKLIKDLREKGSFSQKEIADRLEIARTSYIAIEQGKRELTLSEAHKLADMFGIEMEDLETGIIPNYEKYKEMILAYLRVAGHNIDGKIPKTKLAKLLYLADFAWFYEHLESMSGMKYRKIEFGPVPDMYFRALAELEDEGLIFIERKGDAILIGESEAAKRNKLSSITSNEKKLIKQIAKKWKEKKTKEIVKFTHEQLPYSICENNEIIPYSLITQEDPEYVF
jgi:DNA-binding XRE family transcriptional regulator